MQHMIKLIKFMVGSLSRETNNSLTHMITTSSLAKGYNYCLTFNKPMLHPDWIEECWRNRHKIGCKAVSIAVNFQLRAFAELGIYFTGPDPVQIEEMEEYAIKNSGKVVHFEDTECTHMAVDKIFSVAWALKKFLFTSNMSSTLNGSILATIWAEELLKTITQFFKFAENKVEYRKQCEPTSLKKRR